MEKHQNVERIMLTAEEIEEKELEERRNWKRKYWTGFGGCNPLDQKGEI